MATDVLTTTFSALADPTRRSILDRLQVGQATVSELAAPFTISAPAISKHLRVLEHAGLITRGREAQFRPCLLEAEPMRQVTEWTDPFRRFWDANYARLDTYLEQMKREENQS